MALLLPRRRRVPDLGAPRRPTRGPVYDPEAFGRFAETIARYLGTARFLVIQTVIVAVWISWNVAFRHNRGLAFDRYPFILLTLALSLQASYAAPLILLAQNRQEHREKRELEVDRRQNARALADTEYMARELAAIRLSLGEMPDRDYLDDQLERIAAEVAELRDRLEVSGTSDGDQRPGRPGQSDAAEPPTRRG